VYKHGDEYMMDLIVAVTEKMRMGELTLLGGQAVGNMLYWIKGMTSDYSHIKLTVSVIGLSVRVDLFNKDM